MNIDEYDFELTAKAVFHLNKFAAEKYETWQNLKSYMVSMAYQYCDKSNSFSMSGFQLTAYNGHDGERNVRASVSSYCALTYLKEKNLLTSA